MWSMRVPKYFPLELPPGVYRPGTVYDARGRWYDTQLVRWSEGVLQAVGGWQGMSRTAEADAVAVISDDGGSFTDETTDAGDVGTDDVVLVPNPATANDALYVGFTFKFEEIVVNVSTAASDGTVTWQFWNGSAWTALSGVVDDTDAFQESGENSVSWTLPATWAKTTVNSQGPFYYVRALVATGTSTALATTVKIGRGPVDLEAVVRGAKAWRTNAQAPYVALGTPTELYLLGAGTLTEITPSSFTTGGTDATQSSGNYGAGAYGAGPYGTGDEGQDTLTEANTWQMDNYGEDLVAVAYSDGKVVYYDTSAGGLAAAITNAPTGCLGVVVTPERFIVALGAGGDPRYIQWPDRDDRTNWTAGPGSEAGDHNLATDGQILAGHRGRGETLIWTDVGLHTMQYIGGEFIYTVREVGSNCGAISRRSMAVVDGKAVWMGKRGFFVYDGYVKPIPSEVSDYVFSDINRVQASKIHAVPHSEFGEVWFFYPSAAATECDRYVVYNYRDGYMYIGTLARTAGVDAGVFQYPIWAGPSGVVYQHNSGASHEDEDGNDLTPYAVSGPIDVAYGDQMLEVTNMIPDESTLGEVQITLLASFYPTDAESTFGPFTPAQPTNVRITARQMRVKIEQVDQGWRFGTLRLEGSLGGRR